MEFILYNPANREEWDRFVLSNPQAALGHLSSQFSLAKENIQTTNHSIMIYQNPTHLVGVLPLYEVKSVSLRTISIRTLSSTAGPLFQSGVSPSEHKTLLDLLIDHLKLLAKKLNADRISITYPSVIDGRLAIDRFGFYPLRRYGYNETNMLGTYLDLRRDEAELLTSVEKNCRYKIRKAEKDGVTISPIEKREDWLACESLNEQTLGSSRHSRRTMEVVWDEFIVKGFAYAFMARQDNRVLGVEVIQTFNQCAYAWIAYNARPIFPGANNYLLWRSILHAKNLGNSYFLMGTYNFSEDAKTQGISDFKRSFGGTPYYVLGGTLLIKRMRHAFLLLASEALPYISGVLKKGRAHFKK